MPRVLLSHWFIAAVHVTFLQQAAAIIIDVRLVGGPAPNEGLLEIYDPDRGWGTVCSTGWNIIETIVVCRQLGFPGANAFIFTGSPYGTGTGEILANNVDCQGDEGALGECTFSEELIGCTHERDISVICSTPGYLGCFGDSFNRVLQAGGYTDTDNMTVDACLGFCRDQGLPFAGLEYASECYCGSADSVIDAQGSFGDEECQYICMGKPQERCGGLQRIAIYSTTSGFCNDPGVPPFAVRLGDWFRYGAYVTFECAEGYNISGDNTIQCLITTDLGTLVWDSANPTCSGPTTTSPPLTTDAVQTTVVIETTLATDVITSEPPTTEPILTTVEETSTVPPSVLTTATTTLLYETTLPNTSEEVIITDATTLPTEPLETTAEVETTETDTLTTNSDIPGTETSTVPSSVLTTATTTLLYETTLPNTSEEVIVTDATILPTEPLKTTAEVETTEDDTLTTNSDTSELPSTLSTIGETTDVLTTDALSTDTTVRNTVTPSTVPDSTHTVVSTWSYTSLESVTTEAPVETTGTVDVGGIKGSPEYWPPVAIGLLVGAIILGLLLLVLLICIVVLRPRARAKKEAQESVALRTSRPSSYGYQRDFDDYFNQPDHHANANAIPILDDDNDEGGGGGRQYHNRAYVADDEAHLDLYGDSGKTMDNPYATFGDQEAPRKVLFSDSSRRINHIYVPNSPNGSSRSQTSSDRYGAQLVI